MIPTKADKFRPIPVAKLIIHGATPVPRSLILCGSSPLEAKPRPFWALHIATPSTGLRVKGKVNPAIFLVGGQVELRNKTSNDLIVQALGILQGKYLEAFPEISAPLTHDVVGGNLLGVEVVGSASRNHIVCVGVAVKKIQ